MLNKVYLDPELIDKIKIEKEYQKDNSQTTIILKAKSDITKYILTNGNMKVFATTINNANLMYIVAADTGTYHGTITISTAEDFAVTVYNTAIYINATEVDDIIGVSIKAVQDIKYVPIYDEDDIVE